VAVEAKSMEEDQGSAAVVVAEAVSGEPAEDAVRSGGHGYLLV
jgi:hypothetical protein